jgi:hypothetical protein
MSLIDDFKSEVSKSMIDAGVLGQNANQAKSVIDSKLSEFSESESKEKELPKYVSYLNEPSDLIKVAKIIFSKTKSVKTKRTEVKKFLKDPENIDDFFKSILNTTPKKETKEAMATGGAYAAMDVPLFSKPSKNNEIKTVKEESLKGGNADHKKLTDIAKKHDKKGYYHIDDMISSLKKQLNKGINVEMEHTNNKDKAKEIAMDHLWEDPNYYDKLKKIETKEATTSASIGPYDANSFQNIKMKGNTTEGKGRSWKKTQIPGGSFVQVKEKCKKFPYCNQGDIKALKIFKEEVVNKTIEKMCEKYNLNEDEIREIILKEFKYQSIYK